MLRSRDLLAFIGGVWLAGAAAGHGDDGEWSRFRGPNGSGVRETKATRVQWTQRDWTWKTKLPGIGHSSPVLWEGHLYLTSGDEETGQRIVLCVEGRDGRILWTRQYPAARHGKHTHNSFASSTPVVAEDLLYATWATPQEYVTVALRHDGTEAWRIDLGPYRSGHGFGVSPILHGELLILCNEQNGDSAVVAVERSSGAVRWKLPRHPLASYSTPCIYQAAGGAAELILTAWKPGITAVDPRTGRTSWEVSVFDQGHTETSIGSPVVAGDLVLGVSGWLGYKTQVIAVRPEISPGGTTAREVYRIERGAPLSTTPLVVGGLLFLWADEGIVTCADAATGKIHWQQRVGNDFYGSPVSAGGRIYNVSTDGEVYVLEAGPTYRLLARNSLDEPSHSTPAIGADGTLYFRTFSSAIAIGPQRADDRSSSGQ